MENSGWLKEVFEEVKEEVDKWPTWMRDREYVVNSPDQGVK